MVVEPEYSAFRFGAVFNFTVTLGGLFSQQLMEIAGFYLDAAEQRFQTEVEGYLLELGVEIGRLQAEELQAAVRSSSLSISS